MNGRAQFWGDNIQYLLYFGCCWSPAPSRQPLFETSDKWEVKRPETLHWSRRHLAKLIDEFLGNQGMFADAHWQRCTEELFRKDIRMQPVCNFKSQWCESLQFQLPRLADWNVSSVVLESGNVSGAFLQTPTLISRQYWIKFLAPWRQDFIQCWAGVWHPYRESTTLPNTRTG